MKYNIRELGISEMLDHTVTLFKDHFKFCLKIFAFTVLPASILYGIFFGLLMADIQALTAQQMTGVGPDPSDFAEQFLAPEFWLGFTLVGIIYAVGYGLCQCAVTYGIAKVYVGEEISVGDSIKQAAKKLMGLIAIGFLTVVPLMLGFMLLIIPGVILMLMWYLVIPVYVIEDTSAFGSLGRSARLMDGHKGKVFVLGLLYSLISGGISTAGNAISDPTLSFVFSSVISGILLVVTSIMVTVVYFSARSKVDNYDLELLAKDVQGPEGVIGPVL